MSQHQTPPPPPTTLIVQRADQFGNAPIYRLHTVGPLARTPHQINQALAGRRKLLLSDVRYIRATFPDRAGTRDMFYATEAARLKADGVRISKSAIYEIVHRHTWASDHE